MRGILKQNEPLAPYTSWHIGGPAECYYRPADAEDLLAFLSTVPPNMPLTWLGLGSNVLISDTGLSGVVIHCLALPHANTAAALAIHTRRSEFVIIRVEAQVPCAKIAKFCAQQGLRGAEFFAGIPGTLGGALAMNAGAWGSETWQHVVSVEVVNRQGQQQLREEKEYQTSYRSVQGPEGEWFIAAYLSFTPGEPAQATQRIKALLQERKQKQPIGVLSCGSVFKNPLPQAAGQLIEAAQLKGYAIGDAEVSSQHANFIINRGQAAAMDVWRLIQHIQRTVFERQGVQLQPEVKFLGVFNADETTA